MINYKIILTLDKDEPQEHIVISRDDGSFESFPVDETNPRYQKFLEETAQ
jgi:hypothetical protein